MPADPLLAASLRAVKTRPMFFGFVGTVKDATLLIRKTKIPAQELAEAKKNKGGTIYRGVCHWKDGELIFEIGVEPPGLLDDRIRKAIKRDAEMNLKVVVRHDPGQADEEDKPEHDLSNEKPNLAPKSEKVVKREEGLRDVERAKLEVRSRYHELHAQVKSTLSDPQRSDVKKQFGSQLEQLLTFADRRIQSDEIEEARTSLNELETRLRKLPNKKVANEGADLIKKLDDFAKPIQELLKGRHKLRVKQLLDGFANACEVNNFNAAGRILKQLESYIKPSPGNGQTTTEWTKSLDVGRYNLGKKLGEDGGIGYAQLMEPHQNHEGPPLVAKFVHPWQRSKDRKERFLETESEIYRQIGDHPNIPKCAGVQLIDGKNALVLEAVEGVTLHESLDKLRARLTRQELTHTEFWGAVQHMMTKLLQTLAHIEDKGLVHSDIGPKNLMIDKNGELKVIDLGGAVNLGGSQKQGTPGFKAPETEKLTGAFDVFSTGKVTKKFWPKSNQREGAAFTEFLNLLTHPDPKQRPSARVALSHPFLAGALLDEASARNVLKGQIESDKNVLSVTPGFSSEAWEATLREALRLKMVHPASDGVIAEGSDTVRRLQMTMAQIRKTSRNTDWPTKVDAIKLARELIEAIKATRNTLSLGAAKAVDNYFAQIDKHLLLVEEELQLALNQGPPELTQAHFAEKWRSIKAYAEENFQSAIKSIKEGYGDGAQQELAKLELDKLKSAEKYFKFNANFSGALDAFEKAAAKKDKSFGEKKAKALNIAKDYFQHVKRRLGPFKSVDPDAARFMDRLMLQINDLAHSIDQKKV